MFGRPLSAVTAVDVQRLCKEHVRESDVVEFKRELSGNKGTRHRWYDEECEVGDAARDAIANELMAFANAHGGTLVLGIAETKDKPARADTVIPIPRCAELARRLAQMLGDIIEPSFAPFPAIVPVKTEGDAGVIVFQVAASRNAPHRHRQSRQSYTRRGEESVPMTMREIQDLTLQLERGLAFLDRQFIDSATRFGTMCRPSTAMAMRATAIPLSKLVVPIPGDKTINPQTRRFRAVVGKTDVELVLPHAPNNFNPILRGLRAREKDDFSASEVTIEVSGSGALEIFFIRGERPGRDQPTIIFLAWFLGMACNAMIMADYLRNAGGAPGTEYGLELAVHDGGSLQAALRTRNYGTHRWLAGTVVFPRYSLGNRANFQDVVRSIEVDFWNAVGLRHTEPPISVDFG